MNTHISANLSLVRGRISEACARVSRNPDEVSLVVVTKYSEPEAMCEILKHERPIIFGESRVQDIIRKSKILSSIQTDFFDNSRHLADSQTNEARQGLDFFKNPPLNGKYYLHFIGHLQTNKVKALLPYVDLLQSLDRLSLANALEKALAASERILPCFIQVNLSGDETRFGFTPETIRQAIPVLGTLKHLRVLGLMTMAPFVSDQNIIRQCFQELKDLKDNLREEIETEGYTNINLKELSMGMSQDFEIGLEEGATCIRVGSAIFKENQ